MDRLISDKYKQWEDECSLRYNKLKKNEEELNRIFINIYGLNSELSPYVKGNDVTVRKADLQRDIKSLISYSVGCMFGRYSIDSLKTNTVLPYSVPAYGIISICGNRNLQNDIYHLFVQFIKTVYGTTTLNENLHFISEALGGKDSPEEIIYDYFSKAFFSDHSKIYQNCPIYWLLNSGRYSAFKCLVYYHKFNSDTIDEILSKYVPLQINAISKQLSNINQNLSASENKNTAQLQKSADILSLKLNELSQYKLKLISAKGKNISFNYDDGIKYNYEFFKELC